MSDYKTQVDITPRRFKLVREVDVSGISGIGVVAFGIMFGDRSAVLRWCSRLSSTAVYSDIEDVVSIHGHEGNTKLEWIDP